MKTNSYQRAKARVKELEALNEKLHQDIAFRNAEFEDLAFEEKMLIERLNLQEHFAKLSEKDIHEKNEIIAINKRAIRVLAIMAISLVWAIIVLITID